MLKHTEMKIYLGNQDLETAVLQPFLDHRPVIAVKFNYPIGYHTCWCSTKARQFTFYCIDVASDLSNLCINERFVESLNCIHWYIVGASSLYLKQDGLGT